MAHFKEKNQSLKHPESAAQQSPAQHEERLLDDALKQTFPASDPIAELPEPPLLDAYEEYEECELDNALEMTFPASDPIATSHRYKNDKTPDLYPASQE